MQSHNSLNKNLFLILATLIIFFLITSCATPTPAPVVPEAPVSATEVSVAPVAVEGAPAPAGIQEIFPNYPATLPDHCDQTKVQTAYEWAKKWWVNPIQKSGEWEPNIKPAEKRWNVGFIQGLAGFPADSRMVDSSKYAADLMCVDLVTFCDSKYEAEAAINCAQVMKDRGVDGVINSNWFAPSMDAMGEILQDIPTIVNEVPMPGAPFYGVDNCFAGETAGNWLVDYVKNSYDGDLEDIWVVNNENPDVGEVPMQRITCMETVLKEALPEIPANQYMRIPGGSFTDKSFEAMTTWLTAHPDAKLILTTNINDNGAVGAATACDTAGRSANCAVVGHGGEAQAWNELDKPEESSALKASVDFVQNEYGRYLVPIIVDMLEGETVPDTIHNYIYVLDRSNMQDHLATRPSD
jgi:ribose transport system substrate-binding protein